MVCDLCGQSDPPLQQIDGRSVCGACSSDGVLLAALSASAQLKKLKEEVVKRVEMAAAAAEKRVMAEYRMSDAQNELDEAIKVLALAIRDSTSADRDASDATRALDQFESTHDGP